MVRLNKNLDFNIFDYKELEKYGVEYSFTSTGKKRDEAEGDNTKIYGHGFSSEPIKGEVRKNKIYKAWISILRECYGKSKEVKKNFTICDEWLDFVNFRKWYQDNYYESDEERVILTRNLIKLDNTHYSPETCIFAPQRIVAAMRTNFQKSYDINGEPLPLGITYKKDTRKYNLSVTYDDKHINVACSNCVEDLLPLARMAKEKELRRIAELYKSKIPERLYNAILNFDFDYFFSTTRGENNG